MNHVKRKTKSRMLQSLIMLAIFFALLPQINAITESELRSRINERNDEIAKLEKEIAVYQETLSHTEEKSQTLQGEVVRITTQIKKLSTDIRLTQNRIHATELQIEELDEEISNQEQQIYIQRNALAETLQTMQQSDAYSLIEVLLQNKRISDFFGHLEDMQSLEESIHDDLENLRGLKTLLEEERASRTNRHTELSFLQNELDDRRSIEEFSKKEKATLLSITKNEEQQYQQLLSEREQKRGEMLDEILRIEDELRRLIDPSAIPEAGGILVLPLKGSAVLTQSFGNTPDSKILYNGKPHNGIDLKASVGTPLYAAGSGFIKEIGNTDAFPGCLSYGKWILIEHPNNLSTLYAHLSKISVQKGDSIIQSDLIGYTGATGYATGPHLHFTVYDASTVQFRSSKLPGSTCQFLPYGGYLNPLAYLNQ
jgi:murein DD-endopeptidase MepM/ murein hydrolase activator NlpD